MVKTDFLVIGSGIAGLSYAIRAAMQFPDKQVTIVTKSDDSESNTKYAQGGIAVVLDNLIDSFEKHIEDTLRAGDGLCNEQVVEMVVREGPVCLQEIIAWGVSFDEDEDGTLALAQEGGHTARRIIHYKDASGLQIEKGLLERMKTLPNIQLLSHHFTIDLITDHHLHHKHTNANDELTCYGAYVMDEITSQIETYASKVTLLATGGSGQVYRTTTNPLVATGDGVAMAYHAKAKVCDMEFVQFHPTALYAQDENPAFLITEAIRGHGGYLRNKDGKRFVFDHDPRGELASRDIVALAIDHELVTHGHACVYLDCTHFVHNEFLLHFPNIYEKCLSMGIDVTKDMIPVKPAAHYQCGGIDVDIEGRTSIRNLYACGECARTGLHGANRLASNSLLEAIVFARRCVADVADMVDNIVIPDGIPEWDATAAVTHANNAEITRYRNTLRDVMSDCVGVVRSDERLVWALDKIRALRTEVDSLYQQSLLSVALGELRNLVGVAEMIVEQSLARQENRGGFYNVDLSAANTP